MNISKSMNIILFTTLFLIFSNSLFSQKLEFGKRMTFQDHTITSKIMGYDYQLRISFPESYSTKDTISYPVLYVLNGIYDFKVAQERMSSEGEVEDVIIVGVGFENNNSLNSSTKRHYDFTPSVNTLSERKKEKFFSFPEGAVKSGGAAKFLECIKTEISLFVDKHYKTNTDRGISGSGLGGLFTAYCFINSNGYFTRFGINSPSLVWNEDEVLNQAILQFTENEIWDIPSTKVFISSSKPFINIIGQETVSNIPRMLKFYLCLESSNYENIELTHEIFVKEPNRSIWSASSSRTLSVLYAKG